MTTKEKIVKLRKLYITAHNAEPKSVIVGCDLTEDIKDICVKCRSGYGVEIYGMLVIKDKDKPSRIEVGNLVVE